MSDPLKVVTVSDFLQALYLAEEKAAEGDLVMVAGSLVDLELPTTTPVEGFGVTEWRESWLARLERSHIGFIPLAVNESPQIPREALLATNVIRSFTRASKALDTAIKSIQVKERRERTESRAKDTGYVCGRPPYGYRAVAGQLKPCKDQVKAIRTIFATVRKGGSVNQSMRALKSAESPGYWDGVKVRRILRHARLYCLGECAFRGKIVTIPELAVLPADWVDTYQKHQEAS